MACDRILGQIRPYPFHAGFAFLYQPTLQPQLAVRLLGYPWVFHSFRKRNHSSASKARVQHSCFAVSRNDRVPFLIASSHNETPVFEHYSGVIIETYPSGSGKPSDRESRITTKNQIITGPASDGISTLKPNESVSIIVADDQIGSSVALAKRCISGKDEIFHICSLRQGVVHTAHHRVRSACRAFHNHHFAIAHLVAIVARSAHKRCGSARGVAASYGISCIHSWCRNGLTTVAQRVIARSTDDRPSSTIACECSASCSCVDQVCDICGIAQIVGRGR